MSVNLESVLKNIQSEKNTKLTSNNLRYGVNCMGVQGGLHPVTIEGGNIGEAIYLQDTTPEDPNGIWINTDKTYDKIYLENERYATDGSILFSNADTTDPSNPIANHTNNNMDLRGATYAQKGNVVHFFGYYSSTPSQNTTELVHRHWKYDFDTDTWTQLSDCPTPQGGVKAVWIGDYIYIFGTAYPVNSDYRLYAYKYDTINDIWTRLADIPTVTYIHYGLGCVYDNDDTIYILGYDYNYKYIISTGSYIALTSSSSIAGGYNNCIYYNNRIYCLNGFVSSNNNDVYYSISTNTWAAINVRNQYYYGPISGSGYPLGGVLINNKLYGFSNNSSNSTLSNTSVSTYPYGWVNLDNPSNYKKITTTNSFSNTVRGIGGRPICNFTTARGNVIVFFAGIASGTSTNNNNQIGIITEDKDYTDLEDNTLIIYSTDGTMGTYTTSIYQNEKVVNGKIYQRFNDANLWDAENQTLIKNLRTYYGNGTDWIQIK